MKMDSVKLNGNYESKGIEDRFSAAVNVIRSLPKNGSYQPSNDMMLRFYSYYKQATLGPCTQKKPPFWDVVGRAKYDAYKALGKMSKERAMEYYVDELKKIIETMSYTDNVADFMGSVNELDGVDVDDLEAVAPDAMKKVRSNPNSPFASREASPVRVSEHGSHYQNGMENGYINGNAYENNNRNQAHNGHLTTDPSDDEYIDTVEDDSHFLEEPTIRYSRPWTRRAKPPQPDTSAHNLNSHNAQNASDVLVTINELVKSVETMRTDMQHIHSRINLIERSLSEVKNQELRKKMVEKKQPIWWPLKEISPTWFFFMLLWPFAAQKLVQAMQKRK